MNYKSEETDWKLSAIPKELDFECRAEEIVFNWTDSQKKQSE